MSLETSARKVVSISDAYGDKYVEFVAFGITLDKHDKNELLKILTSAQPVKLTFDLLRVVTMCSIVSPSASSHSIIAYLTLSTVHCCIQAIRCNLIPYCLNNAPSVPLLC